MTMMPQSTKYKPYRDMHTVSGNRFRKDGDYGTFDAGPDWANAMMSNPGWYKELERKRKQRLAMVRAAEARNRAANGGKFIL